MYCKNCGSEIRNDAKFCSNCGYDSIESSHDLDCVTKISTPLFILFNFLTLGIYGYIKWYRMTGDLRKIVTREETVSPLIITVFILAQWINYPLYIPLLLSDPNSYYIALFIFYILQILWYVCFIMLYCHVIYHTLNNIRKIARLKQNKDLKYNKFWAFIFNILYINFVFNTYDKRLVENKK